MLVHGDFWVNLDAVARDIFLRFRQCEFIISILLPFFVHRIQWMVHNIPVFRQNPQGLSASLTCGSCKMWLPMCQRRLGPVIFETEMSEHCLQHCSSGPCCVVRDMDPFTEPYFHLQNPV